MHNRYSWAAAFALTVILAGRKQAPPLPAPDTHDADVKAIRDLETATVQAIAAKDLDKASAFYADDASLFMPDGHVFNGMAAIKAAFKPIACMTRTFPSALLGKGGCRESQETSATAMALTP